MAETQGPRNATTHSALELIFPVPPQSHLSPSVQLVVVVSLSLISLRCVAALQLESATNGHSFTSAASKPRHLVFPPRQLRHLQPLLAFTACSTTDVARIVSARSATNDIPSPQQNAGPQHFSGSRCVVTFNSRALSCCRVAGSRPPQPALLIAAAVLRIPNTSISANRPPLHQVAPF